MSAIDDARRTRAPEPEPGHVREDAAGFDFRTPSVDRAAAERAAAHRSALERADRTAPARRPMAPGPSAAPLLGPVGPAPARRKRRAGIDHHENVFIAPRAEGRLHNPVMVLLVLVATAGILLYAQFLLNPAHRGDFLPYTMVIVAESVLVIHALISAWTILSGGVDPRDFAFHQAQDALYDRAAIVHDGLDQVPNQWPLMVRGREIDVDVFITVYGEEIDKIAATVEAAIAIKGRHRTWVLDDGRDDEVRRLASRLGARYVRRLTGHGAKAGNINHALTLAKGEFFAVFDADFVPKPEFLHETVPFFVDEGVSFVQTPQTYGNLVNLVSRGAGYMQAVFYRYIQPGRNRFNAAFCVGTNVIFRRTAVDDIGGIYTDSKSEDVWTSMRLHERGWKSIYIPKELATGDAPETIEAYSKQQLRWATGGFEILLTHNPLSPRRRLTIDQRLQYLVTSTFYLTGIAPGLLLLVPPLEIYFDLRPMNLSISFGQWLLYYAGFYVMQIVLAFYTLMSFRWETLMLAAVSFPIYAKALWNVITGKEQSWHVTGANRGRAPSPFNFIIPQVLTFVFLALTSFVAAWRDIGIGHLTLATAWNVTNTIILGAFIIAAAREGSATRLAEKLRDRLAARASGAVPTAAPTSAPTPALASSPTPAPASAPASAAAPSPAEREPVPALAARADTWPFPNRTGGTVQPDRAARGSETVASTPAPAPAPAAVPAPVPASAVTRREHRTTRRTELGR
ncbi:glycosyltransferase family 2 protein [Curtobacterium sp. Leaf261]|uniref:glycosyltransferase family 2 protein n=1 Tax=Curtobacterium sp. Leaf261 TaxID=1736311 RepID=UPI000A4928E3|nr:cellulose synthase catalytic subunit [Curtobacterium sp. Leaf261]